MIYTLTLNPALDYVMNVPRLDSKDVIRSESEQILYGGKGINVSVILTNLGIENVALGFVAGFSGKKLEEMLNKDEIRNDFVFLHKGNTRINVKIRSERNMEINANGPVINADDTESLMAKLDDINQGDTLVIAGSVPSFLPEDIYEKILDRLDGRGVEFVVDTTGNLLMNSLKYNPFLVKPNHHELGELFGVEISNTDDVIKYAGKLQELGAKNVLVSMGKYGAILLDEKGKAHKSDNVEGKIVSAVGCGDSMVAGFIAGWETTRDYAYALRLGSACGNATAFSNSLATKSEIEQMLEKL